MMLVQYLQRRGATISGVIHLFPGVEKDCEAMVNCVDDGGNFGWKVIFLANKPPARKKFGPGMYHGIVDDTAIEDIELDRYYEVQVYID